MKIIAGLPSYDGQRHNSTALVSLHLSNIATMEMNGSLLTASFNRCWVKALNKRKEGVTHFLMLHADVVPVEMTWIEQLYEEFTANRCQVLSAAIPIKTIQGMTSTAWETGDIFRPRRLTLTEMHARPVTWTHPKLLVNTGMMLVDFTQPWVEQICFTMNDRNRRDENGNWTTDIEPEDWNFSRQCKALGVPVWVTRRVKINHIGRGSFRNDVAWGQSTDPNCPEPLEELS